jgi:sensor histidine kinase YesM
MLIQPFIENALIHGLMHKKGQKRLTISLEVRDVLICKIEDNGIGREAVELIKKRQMDNHKSFAVNAIDNRFKILRSYHKETIGYAFEDFQPDDSQSVVTRLTLRIPIKLRCNEINKP